MKSFSNLLISLHEKGMDLKKILGNREFNVLEKDDNNQTLLLGLLNAGTPYESLKSTISNKNCLNILKDQFLAQEVFSCEHKTFLKDLIDRAESSTSFKKQLLSKSHRQELIEVMVNNLSKMDDESIDKMNRLLGGPKETFLRNTLKEFIEGRGGFIWGKELVQFCQKNHLFIDSLSTIENVRVYKHVHQEPIWEKIVYKCLEYEDVDLLIKFWKKFPEELSDLQIFKTLSLEHLQLPGVVDEGLKSFLKKIEQSSLGGPIKTLKKIVESKSLKIDETTLPIIEAFGFLEADEFSEKKILDCLHLGQALNAYQADTNVHIHQLESLNDFSDVVGFILGETSSFKEKPGPSPEILKVIKEVMAEKEVDKFLMWWEKQCLLFKAPNSPSKKPTFKI